MALVFLIVPKLFARQRQPLVFTNYSKAHVVGNAFLLYFSLANQLLDLYLDGEELSIFYHWQSYTTLDRLQDRGISIY